MEQRSSLIPDYLEPELERVEFQEAESLIPAFVAREGALANRVGQAFALHATAHRRHEEELNRLVASFAAWAQAVVPREGEEPAADEEGGREADDPDRPDSLAPFVQRHLAEQDEAVIGVELTCTSKGGLDADQVDMFARLDPRIEAGQRHCHYGPARVLAWVNWGEVRLGGLT